MNLRQLRYFVQVVRAGNMTRAAEQLHVAQPALGLQVRQLEEDVGVVLLLRHSRGVETTPAGRLLFERALAILESVEDARRAVAACSGQAPEPVRLGLTPALMLTLGPDIAVGVREQVPQVVLGLAEEMSHVLVDGLQRGDFDLVLAYDVPDLPAFVRQPLLHEDLVLVTPAAAGCDAPTATFAEALEWGLVLPEARDTVRELVMRTAAEMALHPTVAFEVRSLPAMKALIQRGAAAGILPFASVADDVAAGTLDARRIVSPRLRRTLYLASTSRRAPLQHEPALAAVIRNALPVLLDRLGPLADPA